MDSKRITELVLQVFSRFFISGVVFLVFTVLLPSYLLVNLFSNVPQNQIVKFLNANLHLTDKFTFLVLLAISVGIVLDLLRVHSVWTNVFYKLEDQSLVWFALKISLVRAFEINIDKT